MAGKGETVKYIIEADTSDFDRGMTSAALKADAAGRTIDRSLSRTSKKTENNFKDIRNNAATAASSIRNFGVAFQAFNTTSAIIGVTALSGAVLELAGAISAAGTTVSVLAPILTQLTAGTLAVKAGVAGLGDAFDAIGKNDGKKFQEALAKLGPEATKVAFAVGSLNKALNSIKLNTQQALLSGIGDTLLQLGANTLPVVNQGFQQIGQSMNQAFKMAASLAGSPVFSGLLGTIFSDTARTVDTLSEALWPLFTIFTNLYMITAPYLQLLAEFVVKLTQSGAAYLSSTSGATAFNIALGQGVIALQQLGSLVGSVFNFLVAMFRTSVNSGNSLIMTLTSIINQMTAWINTAEGQSKLIALFELTSITIQAVADAVGQALNIFFGLIQAMSSLNPQVQSFIIGMLASGLVIRPLLTYLSQLYLAFRVLAVTMFNIIQQAIVVAGALGAMASIALVVAGGFIILGSIIRGPFGSALIVIGAAIAAYIGLSYLLTWASNAAAGAILRQGYASIYAAQTQSVLAGMSGIVAATMLQMATAAGAAGAGLTFAARAAAFLQAALVPLLVLAVGIAVILGMLGLFSGKAKAAQGASTGLGNSLGALQKSLKSVGTSGGKASGGGLSALNTSLGEIGTSAEEAQKGLAGFDKMNVLTDKTSSGAGGLPEMPAMPGIGDIGGAGGGGGLAMPPIDTADFDKAIEGMMGEFNNLKSELDAGLPNPFAEIGKWINANPWVALAGFAAIVVIITGVFIAFGFAAVAAAIGVGATIGLIVAAVVAVIAIIIILWNNWDTVMKWIGEAATAVGTWIVGAFTAAAKWVGDILTGIGTFFSNVFNGIVNFVKQWGITILAVMFLPFSLLLGLIITFKDQIFAFFQSIVDFIVSVFTPIVQFFTNIFALALEGVKIAFGAVSGYFQGVWNSIVNIFNPIGAYFAGVFNGAWNNVKNAFSSVTGFFQGVWNSIVNIFGSVGTAIGNAIGGAFKGVVNTVLNSVSNIINTVVDLINGAINLINAIPGVKIGRMPRVNIPRLAKGGVVSGSTFAEIGEDGAEAVMPLENNTGWIDKLADRINSSNGNNGGQPINLTVQIGEEQVATKIIDLINEKTQMSGRNSIIV